MESSLSPASSLSVDIPKTDHSVEETKSWGSEHFDDVLEVSRNSEKLQEENDIESSTNLVELGERVRRPSEEFDEERELKKPADLEEISGEDNEYERSNLSKLLEDRMDETNKKEDEKMLQAADDFTSEGMENTFPQNVSAEVINGDCCEEKDDLHQSENSEGKGQVEEIQIADDQERTESVQNEDSVEEVPIQDSEQKPLIANSVEADEVADQKSVENTASDSESLSINTTSDNYESKSREGEAKQVNVNTEINIECSPEFESETSSFRFDPEQAGDDVKQIEESTQDVVLEPVSTPESDSLFALRNNEDLNPVSTEHVKQIEESTQDVVLEPVSTPESNSLLALRNNEDLNPDSTEHASLIIPESNSSSIFRNGKVVMAEPAEDAGFISTVTDETFTQRITSLVDSSLDEPSGEPFDAGEAGVTEAFREKNLKSEVTNTEAVGEKNSDSEVEAQDMCSAEEQGEEPKEVAETDSGFTAGKEKNFPFSPEELPQLGFEVDDPDIQEMEDNPKKISDTKDDEASVVDEGDPSPAVESEAKNNGEDSKIVEPEPVNVAAGDQTYNDKSILVKNERSVVAASGNRDQQSESEIQIQAEEKMATISPGSRGQNHQDSENSRSTFLQRIWSCFGVLDWMRSWRD